ncbi:MAG TPA: porin family protein [Burkholderiales bacterium]|nr:porin family protein [Burkholderiales bacterium]
MYRKAIAAFAFIVSSGVVHAQSADKAGWYAGLDLGRSRLGMNGGDVDGALANQGIASATSLDQTDTAFGVNGGYRFNRYFALEGAYARLGSFDYSAPTGTDTIDGKFKASALSLAGVGIYPLSAQWSLYGKAGLARTDAKLEASSESGATPTENTSHTGTGLLVGAGVTYDFDGGFFAKAGWDRYSKVGDSTTGSGPIDLYLLGVGMRF